MCLASFAPSLAVLLSGAAVLLSATAAPAQPPAAGLLPSRDGGEPALRARMTRLGAKLGAPSPSPPFSLAPLVRRADALSAGGRLDEAAALYDLAIEQGTRAPLDVEDPAALVHALVARASIGLARGEEAQAEAVLARALRWDPTLALSPDESTPRVRAAWARVKARAGSPPPLAEGDLGARCDRLVVARRLAAESIELSRVENCRPAARAVIRDETPDDEAIAALGLTPLVAAAAPSITVAVAPGPPRRTPVYKRAWLWVTVSLVAVAIAGAGVGIWAALRPGDSGWNVTPHF